jgi:toxin ParE1/3/4
VLKVVIRPKAQRDLKEIWSYTLKTWSREQANRYLSTINAAIGELRQRPELGRPCDDVSPGLLRRKVERHVIYFRHLQENLLVVRVLHERMQVKAHVANDEA